MGNFFSNFIQGAENKAASGLDLIKQFVPKAVQVAENVPMPGLFMSGNQSRPLVNAISNIRTAPNRPTVGQATEQTLKQFTQPGSNSSNVAVWLANGGAAPKNTPIVSRAARDTGQALAGFQNTATYGLLPAKAPAPQGVEQNVAHRIGNLAGFVPGLITNPLSPANSVGENAAQKAVSKLAPNAPRLVQAGSKIVGGNLANAAVFSGLQKAAGQPVTPIQNFLLGTAGEVGTSALNGFKGGNAANALRSDEPILHDEAATFVAGIADKLRTNQYVSPEEENAVKQLVQENLAVPQSVMSKIPQDQHLPFLVNELESLVTPNQRAMSGFARPSFPGQALTGDNAFQPSSFLRTGQNHETGSTGTESPQNQQKSQNVPSPSTVPQRNFVDTSPLSFNLNGKPNQVAGDIRAEYSGAKNKQVVIANQLASEVTKLVPKGADREGLTLLIDTGGDKAKLQAALNDPKFAPYKDAIQSALNPTPEMLKARDTLNQYFQQTGKAGQDAGFINQMREDYINRLYKPEPPDTNIKAAVNNNGGLPQTTYHAKGRVYPTIPEAISAGKQPATLDAADLVKIHGGEFARTLTNNKLLTGLKSTGLALDSTNQAVPQGYTRIGNSNTAVPQWLSTGLKAVIDPNFTTKIDELRNVQKYQGLVKTVDLSVSLFHHFTMGMQLLYQTKMGAELPAIAKLAKTQDFNKLEQDFVRNTGMTSNIDANKEVLSRLGKGNSLFGKATQLPIVKQAFQGVEKNNEFLFGTMQKWLKVMDYSKSAAAWVAKHPDATNEEVTAAKRGFAKEVNAAYGGLNWEAMGKTPSFKGVARLLMLAPDWTASNIALGKYALQGGTAGSAARSHIASALIGGAVITEGLNKLITGHYTNDNAKGHQFEVEVRPGVYVSFFRGGIGDLLKEASNVQQQGAVKGTAQFAQGKFSPLFRTVTGLASGVDYNGNPIAPKGAPALESDKSYGKYIAQNVLPVPFGIGGVQNLAKQTGKAVNNPLDTFLTGSGLAKAGARSDQPDKAVMYDKINQQAYQSKQTSQDAVQLHQQLSQLPPDQANAKVAEIYKTNRPLYDRLEKVVNDEKLSRTKNDSALLSLGVANGERAKYIHDQAMKMKTPQERNAYIQQLQSKKIVTDQVAQQLKALIAQGQ